MPSRINHFARRAIFAVLASIGLERRDALVPMFRKNVFSHNGEDGVLEYLCWKLNIPPLVVTLGANDGKTGSVSRYLIEQGFSAVLVEPDPECVLKAQKEHSGNPNVKILDVAISDRADKLEMNCQWHGHYQDVVYPARFSNELLRSELGCREIGLLKIDIDGPDNLVLQSINFSEFRPFVICAEVNSSSLESLREQASMLKSKGYELIGHGGNAFYLRADLVPQFYFRMSNSENPFERALVRRL